MVGNPYRFEVKVDVAALSKDDIGVEVVLANQIEQGRAVKIVSTHEMSVSNVEGSLVTYTIDMTPAQTGSYDVAIRVFAKNANLPHRMDFALVKWA